MPSPIVFFTALLRGQNMLLTIPLLPCAWQGAQSPQPKIVAPVLSSALNTPVKKPVFQRLMVPDSDHIKSGKDP